MNADRPAAMHGRVLICAGSDSGGGAGIQADIKTVTALGGFAATAITALTAQNTRGVFAVLEVPPDFLKQQMRVVLEDLGADCIKTGMLHSEAVIAAVAETCDDFAGGVPLVVDPVMVAKGGHQLLDPGALEMLKTEMLPRAALITPNIPEAELLIGRDIRNVDDMRRAADSLLAFGSQAVLLKGGHLAGAQLTDLLVSTGASQSFHGPRLESRHTHGTGCSLASAVAAGIAQDLDLETAVVRARDYVFQAIATAPGLGHGHGPLNHAHRIRLDT